MDDGGRSSRCFLFYFLFCYFFFSYYYFGGWLILFLVFFYRFCKFFLSVLCSIYKWMYKFICVSYFLGKIFNLDCRQWWAKLVEKIFTNKKKNMSGACRLFIGIKKYSLNKPKPKNVSDLMNRTASASLFSVNFPHTDVV